MKFKIAIDFAMLLCLPVLMAYSLIGEVAHEWVGISLFSLVVAHNVLNWAWWRNITKG